VGASILACTQSNASKRLPLTGMMVVRNASMAIVLIYQRISFLPEIAMAPTKSGRQ
jgi:hypothetical protein